MKVCSYAMSCHAMSCYVMSCHAMTSHLEGVGFTGGHMDVCGLDTALCLVEQGGLTGSWDGTGLHMEGGGGGKGGGGGGMRGV